MGLIQNIDFKYNQLNYNFNCYFCEFEVVTVYMAQKSR